MKKIRLNLRTLLLIAACSTLAQASAPFAVYARVDKVVLEPNSNAPDTIQVWGVFALADPDSNVRNSYLAPARGYLYFKLAGNPEAARREWMDLKAAAGTGRIVAFGNRHYSKARLRKTNQPPQDPDTYDLNIGLSQVRSDTQYPPVRSLVDYKD